MPRPTGPSAHSADFIVEAVQTYQARLAEEGREP